MTKDTYFELCEVMGTEPVDAEVPVDFDEFPLEVQQAFSVYKMLRDEWDTMSGVYLGKNFAGIKDILEYAEIEETERKFIVFLVRIIDSVRSTETNSKKMSEKPVS